MSQHYIYIEQAANERVGSGQGALKELLLRDPLLFSTESAPSARVYTPSEIYSFIQSVSCHLRRASRVTHMVMLL